MQARVARRLRPVERLDDLDCAVLVRLGSAVARAQLLELAMAKLLGR
jgi:hypothetical protein